MKKLFLLAVVALYALASSAQPFPTTRKLHEYNNQWIGNDAYRAFQNLRMNTLIHGIIDHIDSAKAGGGSGGGGIDSIYVLNDSTFRYRKGASTFNVPFKGIYDTRRKTDSLYKPNDSTLRVIINGSPYDIFIGTSIEGATRGYVDSLFNTIPPGVVFIGTGLKGLNTFDQPIEVDPEVIAFVSGLPDYRDSLGRTPGIDSIQVYRAGVHLYSIKDSTGGVGTGDNWGTQGALVDGFHSGTGKVGDTLRLDTAALYPEILARIPNAPLPPFFEGANIQITGNEDDGFTFSVVGTLVGSNPLGATTILEAGGARDAVIPASGSVPTSGTDNSPPLNNLIANAQDGQLIIIPYGNFWFKTAIDTIRGPKRVNILILGNTYHINASGQGVNGFVIKNQSGAFEHHTIVHMGNMVGKINMPSYGNTSHDNGTGPVWSSFTGSAFTIFNTFRNYIQVNHVEGFKNAIDVLGGGNCVGCDNGSQENNFEFRFLNKNAFGISQRSLDGFSYNDKNVFTGWGGGTGRITGGLALNVNGFATPVDVDPGAGTTLEAFNGAFRSNEYKFMVEGVDSIAEVHGDVTDPKFNITVEGSGVYGDHGFRMRSVLPNLVRDPRFFGGGIYETTWVQEGLGVNAEGSVPIWQSSTGRRLSNKWATDGSGNLVIIGSTLSNTARTAIGGVFTYAPGNSSAEVYKTITASTYTAAPGEVILYNHGSGTMTLPSADNNIGRRITVLNIHASASLTVSNATTYTSVPAGDNMTWVSVGNAWRGVVNAEGAGGGGSSIWTADANGQTETFNLGVKIASKAGAALALPAGTSTIAPINIPSGVLRTTPANGDEESDGNWRAYTTNSIRKRYAAFPESGGLPGEMLRMNGAATDLEFMHAPYEVLQSNISTVGISASTTETSLINGGGPWTTNGSFIEGDILVIEGAGIFSTPISGPSATLTFRFKQGTFTKVITSNTLIAGILGQSYRYRVTIVFSAAGTNVAGLANYDFAIGTGDVRQFSEPIASGLNTTVPTGNVTAQLSQAIGHSLTSHIQYIEAKRKN